MARRQDIILIVAGLTCTVVSIYQLIVLELASFYTLFSVGMTLTLTWVYVAASKRRIFDGWGIGPTTAFWVLMILVSVVIDRIGMQAGYWEYPHYDRADQIRKYIFEWGVALFYHFLALVIGIEIFRKAGFKDFPALILSMLTIVTAVGFLTESLNLVVHSWRVMSMPFTNYRFGRYFLVFQTIGYWLMAIIPYTLYLGIGALSGRRARS